MSVVLNMSKFTNKKNARIRSYSIVDMIIDPVKRKETYDYYNDKYEETKEEKNIFEAWQERYKKGDD